MKTPVAVWLGLVLAAPSVTGQQLLWEQRGVSNVSSFGGDSGGAGGGLLANLGDYNGDGCDDVIATVLDVQNSWNELWILSGADGSTIRKVPTNGFQLPYWAITGAGDVNGDGTPDYAVTILDVGAMRIQTPNLVEVRSGADDTVLWQVSGSWTSQFGLAIAGDLDLDGNGRPDLVVIVPRANGALNGGVLAYAHDGTLLWQLDGSSAFAVGMLPAVDRAGDLDGDGCDDVVVAAYHARSNRAGGAVLSGRTGEVLVRGQSPPGLLLGTDVAGTGDLDGDGVPDFAASASGLAMAFSGHSGKELLRWGGLSMGDAIAGGADLDRDGVPDVVVSDPSEQLGNNVSGAVYAFSGRDGSPLLRVANVDGKPFSVATFGFDAVMLRPCAGNPFGGLAFSHTTYERYLTPNFSTQYLGRVFAWRGAPPGVQPLGTACTGTLAQAPRIGIRSTTNGARVHLTAAPPDATALLLLGLSTTTWAGLSLPLPIAFAGFPGCVLSVAIDIVAGTTVRNSAGHAFVDIAFPLNGPLGVTLQGQWLVLGHGPTAPGALSDALSWQH